MVLQHITVLLFHMLNRRGASSSNCNIGSYRSHVGYRRDPKFGHRSDTNYYYYYFQFLINQPAFVKPWPGLSIYRTNY